MALPYFRHTVVISKPLHYDQLIFMSEMYATSRLTTHTSFTEKLWVATAAFISEEQVAYFPNIFRHFPNVKHVSLPGDCFSAVLQEAANTDAFADGPNLYITALCPYRWPNTYPREGYHIDPSQFSRRITHLYHAAFKATYDKCSIAALTNVRVLAMHASSRQICALHRMLPPSPLADTLEKYVLILGPDPAWDSPIVLMDVISELCKQQPRTFLWHCEEPESWEKDVDWSWDAARKYTEQLGISTQAV